MTAERSDATPSEALDPREAGLREAHDRAALFEAGLDPVFVADVDTGLLIDANAAAARLVGRSREHLVGQHQSTLHGPDGVSVFASYAAGGAAVTVAEVVTADRARVPVEISATVVTLADGRRLLQSWFRDVTLSRRAEEALRLAKAQSDRMRRSALSMLEDQQRADKEIRRLLDEAGEREFFLRESQQVGQIGGWRADPVNNTVTWTWGVYEIVEMPVTYKPDLDTALDYYLPESRVRVEESLRRTLETGVPFSLQIQVRGARSGIVKWAELRGQPHRDADDRIDYLMGTLQDITVQREQEARLRDKTLQLEELMRGLEQRVEEEVTLRSKSEKLLVEQSKLAAMGEMLGAIAHQWRQPLNALGLIIQNIKEAHEFGELDEALMDREVAKSLAQIRHMSKTIDDFRNFFRPDKGETVFDVMQAVGDVISLFAAQLAASEIDYRLSCPARGTTFTRVDDIVRCLEGTVCGFRNEFEHVVMNLVTNAREAIVERRERGILAPAERGLISFDFHEDGGILRIEVRDNGVGVSPDVLQRIFEPYFTTKDPAKGTGLGLYMAKVIVEEHMSGHLSARSTPSGAVFTIELPRQAP